MSCSTQATIYMSMLTMMRGHLHSSAGALLNNRRAKEIQQVEAE